MQEFVRRPALSAMPPAARRRLLLAGLAVLAALAAVLSSLTVTAPRAAAAPAGFVTRCGIHFCLDGRTYYVAGANTYDFFTYGGSYGDTETTYMDKARIDKQMAQLATDKVSVVRLWMFSHESWHGFEITKGVYNDQEFALFDYVIDSARRNGLRVLPVFENYWEAYGGIDTRLTWEGLGTGQANRWRFFNKAACPGCFTQYKNYLNYALNRVNHYSGVVYKDDPTIFSWELMNEPRYEQQGTAESTGGTTLRAWVDEMGAYLKGIDPNHMLDAGLEGHQAKYGFGGDEGNPFVYLQQSPYLDFTSAHPYPTEGWAGLDIPKTRALIDAWISDAHNVVGKPFFMGEWNTNSGDKSAWWTAMLGELETAGGDGDAFWWYKDGGGGGGYDEAAGAPELSVFRAHSDRMKAKSGGTSTVTTTTTRPVTTTTTTMTTTTTRPVTTTTTTTRPVTTTTSGGGTGGCTATFSAPNPWSGGFVASVTVTAGAALNGWKVTVNLPGGAAVSSGWNGAFTGSTGAVTVTNLSYNGKLSAGQSTDFGFQGSGSPTGTTVSCTAG